MLPLKIYCRYGNSHDMGSRLQCYLPPGRGDIPSFYPQPKMVLDLETPEGCKAELTYVHCSRGVRSLCPRLHIAVAIVINTAVRGEIRTCVLWHGSRTR